MDCLTRSKRAIVKGHKGCSVPLITCARLSTESFVHCPQSESWSWWFINDGHTARRDERESSERESGRRGWRDEKKKRVTERRLFEEQLLYSPV